MTAIPLYVVEEHHEAFLIWHDAIENGVLPPTGNLLLHVDEHADIGAPRLHRSLHGLSTLSEIHRFMYDELSCFEFIVPALYQGLFSDIVWIHQKPPQKADQVVVIRSLRGEGRAFDLQAFNVVADQPWVPPLSGDARMARYRLQTVEDPVPSSTSILLDVDLDFFSCEDAVNLTQKLEVTRDAYESFRNDRYHFLRISQGSRIKMQEEEGRYFVYLKNYPDPLPTPLRVTESMILERIRAFGAYLARTGVKPRLINLARSRLSGYTPRDQWEFIETHLVRQLSELYSLDIRSFDSLCARVAQA
jgi:hypothetical protein